MTTVHRVKGVATGTIESGYKIVLTLNELKGVLDNMPNNKEYAFDIDGADLLVVRHDKDKNPAQGNQRVQHFECMPGSSFHNGVITLNIKLKMRSV